MVLGNCKNRRRPWFVWAEPFRNCSPPPWLAALRADVGPYLPLWRNYCCCSAGIGVLGFGSSGFGCYEWSYLTTGIRHLWSTGKMLLSSDAFPLDVSGGPKAERTQVTGASMLSLLHCPPKVGSEQGAPTNKTLKHILLVTFKSLKRDICPDPPFWIPLWGTAIADVLVLPLAINGPLDVHLRVCQYNYVYIYIYIYICICIYVCFVYRQRERERERERDSGSRRATWGSFGRGLCQACICVARDLGFQTLFVCSTCLGRQSPTNQAPTTTVSPILSWLLLLLVLLLLLLVVVVVV